MTDIRPSEIFSTAAECHTIIDARYHPDGTINKLSQSESRALPNQPLARTFGIRNAFTMSDGTGVRQFLDHVRMLLGGVGSVGVDWADLAGELRGMLEDIIEESKNKSEDNSHGKVKLSPAVQALSLRTSLWVLFNMRDNMRSRAERTEGTLEVKENKALQSLLSAVFARTNNNAKINILDSASNPLNLILPSFETLWRVVLRLFIVLHGGESPENEHYKRALVEFMSNPTHAQFRCQLDNLTDAAISAEHVVLEALRLYPPTRRVRRAFKVSDSDSKITIVAADVEAVHLDTQTWGPDAAEFTPPRWKALSSAQKDGFLAFGARPSVCPASKSFGPMVIGLLVGLLLEWVSTIHEDENGASWKWVFGSDSQSNMDEVSSKERLNNERGAYEGLFVSLVEAEAGAKNVDP
ncbi:hypothetical protein BDV19DRAFT_381662 [Aspergillus venezuelensis]